MATTNVPLPTFTDAGLVVATEPELLVGVQQDWVAAFAASGKSLNTELTTPQGQLQQSQAYMLSQLQALLLQLIANVDPSTSSGAFQDALGRIYFLTRQPATYATVQAVVTGVVDQVLTAGAQARAPDGSLWTTVQDVTFDSSGSASVEFRAALPGASPSVGINGLTIYQRRNGWEGITNAAPSIPGVDRESRQSFESRRADSVNIGGRGTAESVRAAVGNVPGVSDVYVYNNGSDMAIDYGATDYPIPAHSIAITVAGGDPQAIAVAIHSKLDAGCGLPNAAGEGTLVTQIIEDNVNYLPPYPQYPIRFVRPAPVQIYVRVEVAELLALPNTYVQDVQRAVSAAITNGYDNCAITVSRARIGAQIVAAQYLPPIQGLPGIVPINIYVGTNPNPTSGSALTLGIDQIPVTAPLNVTVVPVAV